MKDETAFRLYTLNRRWTNASLLVHRHFDGHIVSMQQSGSHWIKNMLSHVLIRLYNLPPMAHIQDDSIIGHTKTPPAYKSIPQIVHSHGYPHALTLKVPGLHFPKYLVLVRDLKESLVSHYERFKGDYKGADFSTYLRGDVRQKTFHSDIWSRIRFMNEWGRVLVRNPGAVMPLRYEDIKRDPAAALRNVCAFFGIKDVTEDIVIYALAESSKEKMAEKPNPSITTTVVRTEQRPTLDSYFTPENEAFFRATCAHYLEHDFGYGYTRPEVKAA
jgi:hypothetical protein